MLTSLRGVQNAAILSTCLVTGTLQHRVKSQFPEREKNKNLGINGSVKITEQKKEDFAEYKLYTRDHPTCIPPTRLIASHPQDLQRGWGRWGGTGCQGGLAKLWSTLNANTCTRQVRASPTLAISSTRGTQSRVVSVPTNLRDPVTCGWENHEATTSVFRLQATVGADFCYCLLVSPTK